MLSLPWTGPPPEWCSEEEHWGLATTRGEKSTHEKRGNHWNNNNDSKSALHLYVQFLWTYRKVASEKSRKGDKNERKYMKMAEKDRSYEGEGEHIDNGGKEEKE